MQIKGLQVLKFRERNIFDDHNDHGHDDHGKKDDHNDHDHDSHAKKEDHDDDDHGKKEDHDDHDSHAKKDGHDHHDDDHERHAHGEFDPHIWLDPINAKVILNEMV